MDLAKNGKLVQRLRKEKGMTQKELAERLGVVPKTVSKWETGKGFPDVSLLSALADILGVNEKSLLSGRLTANKIESVNAKRTKFYVCPCCGSLMQGIGESQIICCGKPLSALAVQQADENHELTITEIENELYLQIAHEMSKEHYVRFMSYTGVERTLTVYLYPEQDCAVRIPQAYSGKIVYYCNRHGLFEYVIKPHRKR